MLADTYGPMGFRAAEVLHERLISTFGSPGKKDASNQTVVFAWGHLCKEMPSERVTPRVLLSAYLWFFEE